MARERRTISPVRVNIGAKAEAKVHIKGEVPASSLGRLVDTFTDMIRPFSEARGLKADILRMQREDVAIEIAKRARKRIEVEGGTVQSVPSKILVPLLEKGSCEEQSDHDMIQRWANLLASASMQVLVEPRFVGILGELSGSQAELLDRIAFNRAAEVAYAYKCFADASIELVAHCFASPLQKFLKANLKTTNCAEATLHRLANDLSRPGALFWFGSLFGRDVDLYIDYTDCFLPIEQAERDVAILESLGLIKFAPFNFELRVAGARLVATVCYYHLTELGFHFVEVCSRPHVLQLEQSGEKFRAEGKPIDHFFYTPS